MTEERTLGGSQKRKAAGTQGLRRVSSDVRTPGTTVSSGVGCTRRGRVRVRASVAGGVDGESEARDAGRR